MSIPKYGKRDGNEPTIITGLTQAGAVVTQLSQAGVLDLLVGYRGVFYVLEVKDKGGKPTPAQIVFLERYEGYPAFVVWSLDEALRAIGAIE